MIRFSHQVYVDIDIDVDVSDDDIFGDT